MREPKDGNKDDQESLLYFLVDKTFNHLVVFIYNSIRILVLILILWFPSIELVFFAVRVTILIVVTLVYGVAGILLALYIRRLQQKLWKMRKLHKRRQLH